MTAKKLLYVFILSCFGTTVFAQDGGAWIKGGLNLANISSNSKGEVNDESAISTFHVGFVGDIPLLKILSLQPGILFTGKGSKIESGRPTDLTYYKATTRPLYVEVPVNVVFKLPFTSGIGLFVGAGPYMAIGVGGKREIDGKLAGITYKSKDKIEFSNDDPTTFNNEEGAGLGVLRRFDYGLNGTAGIQLNKLMISLNYGHGLAKLQSGTKSSDDDANKHRVVSLSLGIKL